MIHYHLFALLLLLTNSCFSVEQYIRPEPRKWRAKMGDDFTRPVPPSSKNIKLEGGLNSAFHPFNSPHPIQVLGLDLEHRLTLQQEEHSSKSNAHSDYYYRPAKIRKVTIVQSNGEAPSQIDQVTKWKSIFEPHRSDHLIRQALTAWSQLNLLQPLMKNEKKKIPIGPIPPAGDRIRIGGDLNSAFHAFNSPHPVQMEGERWGYQFTLEKHEHSLKSNAQLDFPYQNANTRQITNQNHTQDTKRKGILYQDHPDHIQVRQVIKHQSTSQSQFSNAAVGPFTQDMVDTKGFLRFYGQMSKDFICPKTMELFENIKRDQLDVFQTSIGNEKNKKNLITFVTPPKSRVGQLSNIAHDSRLPEMSFHKQVFQNSENSIIKNFFEYLKKDQLVTDLTGLQNLVRFFHPSNRNLHKNEENEINQSSGPSVSLSFENGTSLQTARKLRLLFIREKADLFFQNVDIWYNYWEQQSKLNLKKFSNHLKSSPLKHIFPLFLFYVEMIFRIVPRNGKTTEPNLKAELRAATLFYLDLCNEKLLDKSTDKPYTPHIKLTNSKIQAGHRSYRKTPRGQYAYSILWVIFQFWLETCRPDLCETFHISPRNKFSPYLKSLFNTIFCYSIKELNRRLV